jgi:hypothetical protein
MAVNSFGTGFLLEGEAQLRLDENVVSRSDDACRKTIMPSINTLFRISRQ